MKRYSVPSIKKERGVALLEALIAMLIFSMGILALMGLQAVSIKQTADAKYRADAAFLANQIIGEMWADNPANLASYAHRATAGAACAPGGNASGNAKVIDWLGTVPAASAVPAGSVAGSLPGAAETKQQIMMTSVGVAPTATRLVTITICWQGPQQAVANQHTVMAQIPETP